VRYSSAQLDDGIGVDEVELPKSQGPTATNGKLQYHINYV